MTPQSGVGLVQRVERQRSAPVRENRSRPIDEVIWLDGLGRKGRVGGLDGKGVMELGGPLSEAARQREQLVPSVLNASACSLGDAFQSFDDMRPAIALVGINACSTQSAVGTSSASRGQLD